MNISIIQSNGLLALELKEILINAGHKVLILNIDNVNISDEVVVSEYYKNKPVELIIFAEGFEDLEAAENNREKAFAINSTGALNIAKVCKIKNIPLIYLSTDLVFDGSQEIPYTTEDETNPLNVYGESKLAGEQNVSSTLEMYYIIRTGKLFGNKKANFIDDIIAKAQNNEDFKAIDDEIYTPTWTFTIAKSIEKLIETTRLKINYGIYHTTNSGHCNDFKLVSDILHNINLFNRIYPVKADELNPSYKIPKYRVLNCTKSPGIRIHWIDALNQYLINSGIIEK